MTIAFLTGHSVARNICSLAPLTPLTSSAVLRFAILVLLARSLYRLAHSLCSIPGEIVEIHKICVHAEIAFGENERIFGRH